VKTIVGGLKALLLLCLLFTTSCDIIYGFWGSGDIYGGGGIHDRAATIKYPWLKKGERIETVRLTRRMSNEGWDVAKLDVARDVDYLSQQEKNVFLATNALRSDPRKFAEIYVKEIKKNYHGSILYYPDGRMVRTYEGIRAVNKLYRQLLKENKMGLVYPSKGLCKAAAEHVRDQAKTGRTGHSGSNGSGPFKRMNRYGKWYLSAGENISYGVGRGLGIVLQLLIDDGVRSRAHRENILNKNFKKAGVAIDLHPVYGFICTIDYAENYIEKEGPRL